MKTTDSQVFEAYVIEDDGTKTAVPIGFADKNPRVRYSTVADGRPAYACASSAAGYAPRNPFGPAPDAAPRRKLHLGRRLLGVGIALIGLPLLILPGHGLALIGLGLLMATMP